MEIDFYERTLSQCGVDIFMGSYPLRWRWDPYLMGFSWEIISTKSYRSSFNGSDKSSLPCKEEWGNYIFPYGTLEGGVWKKGESSLKERWAYRCLFDSGVVLVRRSKL